VWIEIQLNSPDSKFFGWHRSTVEKVLRNQKAAECVVKQHTCYALTFFDLSKRMQAFWKENMHLAKVGTVLLVGEPGFEHQGPLTQTSISE
jgi:hypothetical protein